MRSTAACSWPRWRWNPAATDEAASELRAIVDKPADKTLDELARQRLARVLAAQDKADEAIKLLDGKVDAAFVASREELRGDLLVQLGRNDEAHAAYSKAKESLSRMRPLAVCK